jgi:hypothetical protein
MSRIWGLRVPFQCRRIKTAIPLAQGPILNSDGKCFEWASAPSYKNVCEMSANELKRLRLTVRCSPGLFAPPIVKFFSQRGLGVFPRFESGRVPDQRHEHQHNDADVEDDHSDSFGIVFHLGGNASVGEVGSTSAAPRIAARPASALKTTLIFC